ncbi:MAG: hypothetical protein L6R38_006357 [Xanthoria sp. 2 TBL-2021]|nr:MAG: hypothetical protein L6R38_006357 [Xanthoria sp. 2 TBL-2021]
MQALPTLHRMPTTTLSSLLLSPTASANIAVIDVRDSDHAGGHIRSSIHVPSSTLDHKLPELVRTLRSKEKVIFHCALSQQRGPGAALRYMRERERMLGGAEAEKVKVDKKVAEEGLSGQDVKSAVGDKEEVEKVDGTQAEEQEGKHQQEVWVLDGGFVKWQERYGTDDRLTEDYAPDIWNDY